MRLNVMIIKRVIIAGMNFTCKLIVFLMLTTNGWTYKPVVLIHGVLTGNVTMLHLAEKINEIHPGTNIHIMSRFCYWESLDAMETQVMAIGSDIMRLSEQYPDGFNVIGYSQGGLLARAILEYFPEHRVHTFISLSSPQGGQYGSKFLHLIFPNLVKAEAYRLFYSAMGQYISVGNYWNDPHHQDLYYNSSRFLPYINNEKNTTFSERFKDGIVKLKSLILIGGPDDGVISPWQSSHFGHYDDEENVIDMMNTSIYKNDLFGLRTLNELGNLHTITVYGVKHHFWHRNTTVIKQYILPWLN